MRLETDPRLENIYSKYPENVRPKIKNVHRLIIESAKELELEELEETLKWGEPSFLSKHGSTIRIDWKEKTPEIYSTYFKCTSKLVSTFKQVFGPLFDYENNRAIRFTFDQQIPEDELKQCIKAALIYHKVKTQENLGIAI